MPICATTGRVERPAPARPEPAGHLVDSLVWIEAFRRSACIDLPAVADLEEIVVCLPILQEVLQAR